MNVGDLILELMECDPNLPVAREGIEGEHSGLHPIHSAEPTVSQFDTMDWDDKTKVVLLH